MNVKSGGNKMETLKIRTLYMELTHACNQQCKFCYLDGGIHHKIQELTTEEIKDIFLKFKEQGGRYAVITGGEPAVRKDCFDILNYVDSLDIPFTFASNSLLMNTERLNRLASLKNLDLYFTSILGSTEQENNKIAGNNSFRKVHDALTFFENKGISTYVQCTLINEYIDKMPVIAEDLLKYKNCTVKFTPTASLGIKECTDELEKLIVPRGKFAYFHDMVEKLKKQYPGHIEDGNIMNYNQIFSYIKDYKDEKLYSLCYGFFAVRPDGTKSFSCNMNNPYTFGNAKDGIEIAIDKNVLNYVQILREAEASALEKSKVSIVEFDTEVDGKIKEIYERKLQ